MSQRSLCSVQSSEVSAPPAAQIHTFVIIASPIQNQYSDTVQNCQKGFFFHSETNSYLVKLSKTYFYHMTQTVAPRSVTRTHVVVPPAPQRVLQVQPPISRVPHVFLSVEQQ